MNEVNEKLLPLANIDYVYKESDILDIFQNNIKAQLKYPESEFYISSAYQMTIKYYPELKEELDSLLKNYFKQEEDKKK